MINCVYERSDTTNVNGRLRFKLMLLSAKIEQRNGCKNNGSLSSDTQRGSGIAQV